LTNNGELVQELEKKLQEYWKVKNVVCVSNGTMALLLAAKAMGLKKVYTSPYSYIATVGAMAFQGVKPIFIDFFEKSKGPVLATHVYGIPNMVDNKTVLYDASHAFAVKVKGKSILSYGTASAISFHAVKIFQSVEGGAVVTNNDKIANKVRLMRNFGMVDRYSFNGVGINAKMSEFHAAMGLCSLKYIDRVIKKYALLIDRYNKALGFDLKDVTYYPLFYPTEKRLLQAIKKFEANDIYTRRYFYPPLNKVFHGKRCPVAEDLMSRVLCLPLYYDLTKKQQDLVIKVARETLKNDKLFK
jgi:dTDP-4-amino-4,6-dideoxygalactose transaminase